MDFDGFEARSLHACRTGIVCDEVAACGDPGSVWFVYFWADGAYGAFIGDISVFGNLLLGYEKGSIGAFDAACEALGKVA